MSNIEKPKEANDLLVEIKDQTGVENAVAKIIVKNQVLLPNNIVTERIKASAGFYIVNNKKLMELNPIGKQQMLFGILKEAMVGCEVGIDYDIIVYKGEAVVVRNKNGWFKIIDLIKPAEIIRFVNNVITEGDDWSWNPVTETLTHTPKGEKYQDFNHIEGAYSYVKLANGFEKTMLLTKEDLKKLKDISPSGKSEFSPWNSNSIKMCKTKATKELAKDLFTLFSGRVNSVLARAIESDEISINAIDDKGNIIESKDIYPKEHGSDKVIVAQEDTYEDKPQEMYADEQISEVNMNDI